MSQTETTVKHIIADGAATIAGFGSFSAVTMNWLEGISLILAIIASLMSIIWLGFRFWDRWTE